MVVPFVVDERERVIETKKRERERGLQKRHEYGRFRLIVIVDVVIGFKFKKNARWLDRDGDGNINTKT